MKNNYSIECAKAYENNTGDGVLLDTLRESIDNLERENKTLSLVLLVDNISYKNQEFNFNDYSNWLKNAGFNPDLVLMESEIIKACEDVLGVANLDMLENELATTLVSPDKYTSSLFIATWCLLRLGYIKLEKFSPEYCADYIINILPESFRTGEEESLQIIKATPYFDATNKIKYQFVKG